ncbi:DUF1616 domain-containing protein [Thermosphaera chiliense]|uniref:DUF1616 domain-containing protein n=1 Tax=Thermosphaera chiliense TaxID=3402707 RepID=A0A7M1USD4_9CREN|nr:DUF1616 domain-containing protein [Thermosphaera aggregans]QOR94889.1 DUF1616 domain-containing protein [Thermosphaera aggregans]
MKREITLEEYVAKLGKKSRWKALKTAYENASRGRIRLVDPDPPKTLGSYILRLDYSAWFWTLIILTIATAATVYASGIMPTLTPLRYLLGTVYVLFLPGYVLVEALYPGEDDLKPLERLALSIGLSLAVIPLIGLLLNYTPWGIRLDPLITALTLYNTAIGLVAAERKHKVVKKKLQAYPSP